MLKKAQCLIFIFLQIKCLAHLLFGIHSYNPIRFHIQALDSLNIEDGLRKEGKQTLFPPTWKANTSILFEKTQLTSSTQCPDGQCFPNAVWEGTVLSSLCSLDTIVKNHLAVCDQVYFWTLFCSTGLYICLFASPNGLDFCCFVVCLKFEVFLLCFSFYDSAGTRRVPLVSIWTFGSACQFLKPY